MIGTAYPYDDWFAVGYKMALKKYYALYSGGKDSTVMTDVLHKRGELAGVVSFDTGISVPDWKPFVIAESKKRWEIDIEIYRTPIKYDDLVIKFGFPGPGMHGMFMNYLKGRCAKQFKKLHPGEWLASGVRSGESRRRFKNTREFSKFEGVNVRAPIYNWTTEGVWKYFHDNGFKRSPAYERLCISGDCLCGAYADTGERSAIKAFYPEVWQRIEALEKQVDTKWGMAGKIFDKNQLSFFCADCESPDFSNPTADQLQPPLVSNQSTP